MRYVYGSAGHLRRSIAMHGAVRPRSIQELQEASTKLPDEGARKMLAEKGVTRLVVHRTFMGDKDFDQLLRSLDQAGYSRLYYRIEARSLNCRGDREWLSDASGR